MPGRGRPDPLAALLALVVVAGLSAQVTRAMATQALPRGTHLVHLASYFTDQSNALLGVVALAGVLGRRPAGRAWAVLWLAALAGIVVTGLVYAVVLGPARHGPLLASTVLLHYVAPPLAVAVWLRSPWRPAVTASTLVPALAWPAAYLGWMAAYGAATGWYPYAFADPGRVGTARAGLHIALVAAMLAGAGAAIVAVESRRGRLGAAWFRRAGPRGRRRGARAYESSGRG